MKRRLGLILIFVFVMSACASPPPPFPETEPWIGDFGDTLPLDEDEEPLWQESRDSLAEYEALDEVVVQPALDEYFDAIVDRLDPRLRSQAPKIRVVVFEHAYRNASAWPDGSIVITTSLLSALQNEAQLAFLLGHEIAHIRYRHSLLQERYNKVTTSHVERMRFSRKLETDADRLGFELAVAAGYASTEPSKMLPFIDEDEPPNAQRVRSWESHADLRTRILDLGQRGRRNKRQKGRIATDEFLTAIDSIRLRAAKAEIKAGDLDWAERFVRLQITRHPEDGHAYFLDAEINRRRPGVGRMAPVVRESYERAVELAPDDAMAVRALGLLLRDLEEPLRSRELLSRYLELQPEAIDRKLVERYLK